MELAATLNTVEKLTTEDGENKKKTPSKRMVLLIAFCICLFVLLAILDHSLLFLRDIMNNERLLQSMMRAMNKTRK